MKTEAFSGICFNFHGLAGVRLETDNPGALEFFSSENQYHQVQSLPADIPLVVIKFQDLNHPIPPGFVHFSHKVLARWAYQISVSPKIIEIVAYGNAISIPMIHHMLVHPSLRYLVSYQDTLLLHAGAVAYHGRSLIITGQGGAGKTTTTSLLLARGGVEWAVHADDYVFLTATGESLAYLTRAHLYRNLLRQVPEIALILSASERIKLEAFGRVRSWSRENVKWPVRISLPRLWPGHPLQMQAKPAGIIYLTRDNRDSGNSGKDSQMHLRRLEISEVPVDELLEVNFNEARHFLRLLRKCLPEDEFQTHVSAWRQRESRNLIQSIQNIPVFELRLPGHILAQDNELLFQDLSQLVLSSQDE